MNYPCVLSLTQAEYFAAEGVSQSDLKKFDESPVKFKLGRDESQTAAQRYGDLFHHALLEPEHFHATVMVRPSQWEDWRTKEAKVWREEQTKAGMRVVTAEEFEQAVAMSIAVRDHPDAGPWMLSGAAERSVFVQDELTGLVKKGRLDWLPSAILSENGVLPILDIKTCESARADEFERSARRYQYRRQCSWYSDLAKEANLDHRSFIFVAVEKEPPFEVGVFMLSTRSIETGRRENLESLLRYKQCKESGVWASPVSGVQIIEA